MKKLLFIGILLAAPTTALSQQPEHSTFVATPIVLAQASPAEPASTEEPADDKEPDIGELLHQVGKTVDDWGNLGWLAGVIALINLLLNLTKLRVIDQYLVDKDWKWAKPLAAAVLGAALGGFSSFATDANALNSVLAGLMAGLGSVGFHEFVGSMKKKRSKAKA